MRCSKHNTRFMFACLWFWISGQVSAQQPASGDTALSYNQVVRPVLSNHCFACHGPDDEKREADLRLDLADAARLDEVIQRITSDDPDVMMPPPSANKELDEEKISILTQWISGGGQYEEHWAFKLPQKAPVMPDGSGQLAHPVDYFIDRRLKANGLTRSEMADPLKRIRRVYLDLTGLPPTIEQADAFAADPSQTAYEAIVDELLASPRYGERWARRWLDLARYADTNGYEKDRDRSIWPYRDWVIRAINSGMPFDQFTIEQIAGDMLPGATEDQKVATGFHRNTMLNEEGGIDPLEFRYHAMTDRVATTGTTWLGLTTGCAQCHTHKYDPITHDDYFGMMAFMDNTSEPTFLVGAAPSAEDTEARSKKVEELLQELDSHWPEAKPADENKPNPDDQSQPELEDEFEAWLDENKGNAPKWNTLAPLEASADHPYLIQEEGGIVFAAGDTSKHDIYTLKFNSGGASITSLRLEALPDDRLPANGPGLTYYEGSPGDFFLCEFEITLADESSVTISETSYSYINNSFNSDKTATKTDLARLTIDQDFQTGWSVAGREGATHEAVFVLKTPIAANIPFTVRMHFGRHFASSLGKFRISADTSGGHPTATSVSDEIQSAIDAPDAQSNPQVRQAFLLQSPELQEHANKIYQLKNKPLRTETLVMQERPDEYRRVTKLRSRGEYTQPKHAVKPRLPDAIKPLTSTPTNRLEFARWLVSPENPLTARVVVNRQWAALFGSGIVKTLDDFGMQGAPPTHPELLDYLAVDLMDGGWSIKSLHKLIVTSKTYQQSSAVKPEDKMSQQPSALLARFPRSRLEAELIRDSTLLASGLLYEKMYGPPVRPPQPAAAIGANFKQSKWTASSGKDRYRRSVYTYQKRTAPFAMFTTFDAPTGEACIARRDVSNTPLQALTLMNDPMFVEISEALGKRIAKVDGDSAKKIQTGFRLLLTRHPTKDEATMLSEFHRKHDDWNALARVLLCLDETITRN